MASGKLRCLGSAQRLKSKFGQGYQIEMKIKNVEVSDSDYLENLRRIAEVANVELPRMTKVDQECAMISAPDEVFLSTMEQTMQALTTLTGDDFLTSMVTATDATGYTIYKEATSPVGIDIDALTVFATNELRMRNLNEFISQTYPNSVVRERQDTKARFEVASADTKMARIFASIEENKERLLVAEYGVSQTSLEQVFNMHAAEAERLKIGTLDA
jgi:ATP-binding cassette subfamily A (ABC1) protein 3